MKSKSELITITKVCKECLKEFSYTISINNKTINKTFCCKSCATAYNYRNMSDDTKRKRIKNTKATNLKKYGNEWVINSKHSRDLTKQKLGVEYSWQSSKILKKCRETLFEHTGYNFPAQDPSILNQILSTKIKKYGDYLIPMAKYKEYQMPSGKIVKVQGNENYALNILLKTYDEDDIIIGRKNIENEIGKIVYLGPDNKSHMYYPDIYIKSNNKIYEIKSQFTYNVHKTINELKKQAVLDKQIDFEFIIIG